MNTPAAIRPARIPAALTGLVVLFAALIASPTVSAQQVAVVDLEFVITQLEEQAEFSRQIQIRGQEFQNERTQRQEQLKALSDELGLLQSGTEAYEKKAEEILRGTLEFDTWVKFTQRVVQRDQKLHIARMYDKTIEAASKIAEAQGFTILLYKATPQDNIEELKAEELAALIRTRKVLWASAQVDVTNRVIQQMNNEFQARGN